MIRHQETTHAWQCWDSKAQSLQSPVCKMGILQMQSLGVCTENKFPLRKLDTFCDHTLLCWCLPLCPCKWHTDSWKPYLDWFSGHHRLGARDLLASMNVNHKVHVGTCLWIVPSDWYCTIVGLNTHAPNQIHQMKTNSYLMEVQCYRLSLRLDHFFSMFPLRWISLGGQQQMFQTINHWVSQRDYCFKKMSSDTEHPELRVNKQEYLPWSMREWREVVMDCSTETSSSAIFIMLLLSSFLARLLVKLIIASNETKDVQVLEIKDLLHCDPPFRAQ